MRIAIKNKDLGFWTQTEIPVVKYEDELIAWCNHAGAEEETVDQQIDRIDQPDIVWTDRMMICRKCGAYKFQGEDYWEDAPVEGAR